MEVIVAESARIWEENINEGGAVHSYYNNYRNGSLDDLAPP